MKFISDFKKCSGCGVCKLACSSENFKQVTPGSTNKTLERAGLNHLKQKEN